MALDPLTDEDIAILTMEARWWPTAGGKEAAIVDELGVPAVKYYRRLSQLINTEAALAFDPITVNRLRRISTRPRPEHTFAD